MDYAPEFPGCQRGRHGDGGQQRGEREAEGDAPSLHRVEWEHIQRVLADCGGNVSRAARVLGLHRRTLQRKLATRPPEFD